MTDLVEVAARAAAVRLADDATPTLSADVERALASRDNPGPPGQYFDPISLGALIVSVAGLAWTVYKDLRKKAPSPSPEVVTRAVRVRVEPPDGLDSQRRDQIIDITVQETIKAAESA
jgi:hypothetical protein